MHEHRAMAIKIKDECFSTISINGVNFERLRHAKFKDTFTEEDKCRDGFKNFFKRYSISEKR